MLSNKLPSSINLWSFKTNLCMINGFVYYILLFQTLFENGQSQQRHKVQFSIRFCCCICCHLLLKEPKTYFHHEMPTELEGSVAVAATDYNKRPNVFRLKLANGAEYLFQSKDEVSLEITHLLYTSLNGSMHTFVLCWNADGCKWGWGG